MSTYTHDMDPLTLAWLAGLLEGEGCFGIEAGKYPVAEVQMCDRDVIERVANLLGAAVIVRETVTKPQYRVRVRGKKACNLMRSILPYMGERRSARIREILPETS